MDPQDIRVIGVHRVEVSPGAFEEAVESMWGSDLEGADLERARDQTREHFDELRLIEIEVTPPGADVDWDRITQRVEGEPRANWQAPYDEQLIDEARGTWAFFLHNVDPDLPLLTQLGERPLPVATPLPSHLADVEYDLPG